MTDQGTPTPAIPEPDAALVEQFQQRIGHLDPLQIRAWRRMQPAERLEVAFGAYQLALEMVRATEERRRPDLAGAELAWRITRRMQGNPRLGR